MSAVNNQSVIDDINNAFEVRAASFGDTPAGFGSVFAVTEPVDSRTGTITHIGPPPVLREWVDEKVNQTWRAYSQTYTLKRFHKTFELDRMDVEYDRVGIWGPKMAQFFGSTSADVDKYLTSVLVSNPTGYDGVALFSASHPHGAAGATQSNTTSSALSWSTVEAAKVAGMSLKWENGEPIDGDYQTLMVGPSNATKGFDITGSDQRIQVSSNAGVITEQGASASDTVAAVVRPNVMQMYGGGRMNLIINPRLTGSQAGYWYLFRGPGALVHKIGRPLTGYKMTDMEGPLRYGRDKYSWSMECDWVAIAGLWQYCYAGLA